MSVVVITGATAGVGRATAHRFAAPGMRLALLARGQERLEGTRREVEARGATALALSVDVADADALEAAAERIERELGPIDIWINNAMTSVFAPFDQIEPEEFKRVTEVTYLGFVYGTWSALRRMKPRNRGKIVQVGSALTHRSIPLQSAYCGAKHAIVGFTDSLRSELEHDGCRVDLSVVQMPALNTPQFGWCRSRLPHKAQPVPPIYQPEVAAEAVHWAAYHRVRELPVGLNTQVILWGNKFFPGFGDWYLALTGYSGQQTEEPRDPDAPDNLFEPVPGDQGTHGAFDGRATSQCRQLWWVTEGRWVGMGVVAGALLGLGLWKGRQVLSAHNQARQTGGSRSIEDHGRMR